MTPCYNLVHTSLTLHVSDISQQPCKEFYNIIDNFVMKTLNIVSVFVFLCSERKAGLHSASELRQENERMKQRENDMFAQMSSNKTGKNAETVHRDNTGRRRDFKVEEVKKREEERKKEEENEKFMEWGKG